MRRLLLFFVILLTLFQYTNADVAIIAFNSDGDDELVFVVTASGGIASGVTLFITDNEYDSTSDSFNSGEGTLTLVTSTTLPQGTTVIIDPTAVTAVNANGGGSIGTLTDSNNFNPSNGVDHIYIFTTADNTPTGTVNNIFSAFTDSTFGANENPTSDFSNAIVVELNSNDDNAAYDPANGTTFNSVSAFITAIQDLNNYQQTDGSGDQAINMSTLYDGVTFVLSPPPPPPSDVPTLSQWGLIILALSFMTFGTLYILERKVEMDA